MKQHERLRILATFLEAGDLSELVEVRSTPTKVRLEIPDWSTCTVLQRRTIKRLFGPLEVRGSESWKYLRGEHEIFMGEATVLEVYGVFVCELKSSRELQVALSDDERNSLLKSIADTQKALDDGFRIEVKYEYDCQQVETVPRVW